MTKKLPVAVLFFFLAGLLISCKSPTSSSDIDDTNSLLITWTLANGTPTPASYDVTLSKSGEPTQRQSKLTKMSASFSNLASGSWTIIVQGFASDGVTVVARGEGSAKLSSSGDVVKTIILDSVIPGGDSPEDLSVSALFMEGLNALSNGDLSAARSVWERALALDPHDVQAEAWLAFMAIEESLTNERMVALAKDALGLQSYPSDWDSFASTWLIELRESDPEASDTCGSLLGWYKTMAARVAACPMTLDNPELPDYLRHPREYAEALITQLRAATDDPDALIDEILAGPLGPSFIKVIETLEALPADLRIPVGEEGSVGEAEIQLLVAQLEQLRSWVLYLGSVELNTQELNDRFIERREASKQAFIDSLVRTQEALEIFEVGLAPMGDYRNRIIETWRLDSDVFDNSYPIAVKILDNLQTIVCGLEESVTAGEPFPISSVYFDRDFSGIDPIAFLSGYIDAGETWLLSLDTVWSTNAFRSEILSAILDVPQD